MSESGSEPTSLNPATRIMANANDKYMGSLRFPIYFSINGSNSKIYQKSCWDGKEGRLAYEKIITNFKSYISKLKISNLELFAPSVSMVINENSVDDIYDFVKFAITNKARYAIFYFDFSKINMSLDFFSKPEIFRPVLKSLMEIERVLSKKFFIFFRTYLPLKELEILQPDVEKIPIEELRIKYKELLDLVEDRDMKGEFLARQNIRRKYGKKEFVFDEDWVTVFYKMEINNKKVCSAPFKEIDIHSNGMMESCCMINPIRMNIIDWVKNGSVNWEKLYNNIKFKKIRYDVLSGNFTICDKYCPLNSKYRPDFQIHKFGYDRTEDSKIKN